MTARDRRHETDRRERELLEALAAEFPGAGIYWHENDGSLVVRALDEQGIDDALRPPATPSDAHRVAAELPGTHTEQLDLLEDHKPTREVPIVNDDHASDDGPRGVRIELKEDEVKQAFQAGLDTRATAEEKFTRFARPEEREDVGRRIDPATADVFFVRTYVVDPYGDDPDLPREMQQVGRVYFAVDPNEGVAVALYDVPEETREALTDKRDRAHSEGWRRLLDGE